MVTKSRFCSALMMALVLGVWASTASAFDIVALTNNDTDEVGLSASSGNAVWQGQDPNGTDSEIFLYSKAADQVLQLTANDANDINPVIAGAYVAWEVWDGNDFEICVYNGDKVYQITDNDVNDVEPKLSAPFVFWRAFDANDWEINKTALPRLPVAIKCKITPTTLNLKSKGNWIDVMLILPAGIHTSDIQAGTIRLEDQLSPEKVAMVAKAGLVHLKFSRSQLQAILSPASSVKLDITAYLKDGTKIAASDTIRVIH